MIVIHGTRGAPDRRRGEPDTRVAHPLRQSRRGCASQRGV